MQAEEFAAITPERLQIPAVTTASVVKSKIIRDMDKKVDADVSQVLPSSEGYRFVGPALLLSPFVEFCPSLPGRGDFRISKTFPWLELWKFILDNARCEGGSFGYCSSGGGNLRPSEQKDPFHETCPSELFDVHKNFAVV